jgi:AraC-like DNA-binding protein
VGEATVSAGTVQGLIEFAAAQGVDRATLLSLSRIDHSSLADHDNRIVMSRYRALMLAAKELSGNPAFALHYGAQIDLSELSLVGLITRSSPTMLDALMQLNRYTQLVVDIDTGSTPRFEIVREQGEIWMVDNRPDADAFPEQTEVTFARLVCGPRRFTDKLALGAIEFTHPAPAHAAEYDRVFMAPVTFESRRNAMQLDETWLTHPVALTPSYMFGILTERADAMLAALRAETTLRAQVESLLMTMLHSGCVSVDQVSAKLAMSRQTLYRKLKAEGTTFEAVVDELRHKLALDYIGQRKVSVNQAAYLTGFSDPSAFSRAFKRWTGRSPRAMMKEND